MVLAFEQQADANSVRIFKAKAAVIVSVDLTNHCELIPSERPFNPTLRSSSADRSNSTPQEVRVRIAADAA